MIKYQVVQRRSQHELSEKINLMLSEGWKLQGGIAFISESSGYVFAQAMIKSMSKVVENS